jgi:tetratricopeptide (TPR) repeat protein
LKKQILLVVGGILLVCGLYFFGKTSMENKPVTPMETTIEKKFDVELFVQKGKDKLTSEQKARLKSLEINSNSENYTSLTNLANFWNDSVHNSKIYSFYISKAAKLDNSEKSLTFAAQLFLELLRGEQNAEMLEWESTEAISLFEKAININPNNEDLKIGLGSCYVFGKGRNGDPAQTMKGIQELLGVVRRDSTNMKAQLVLGIGGCISGQYDKAIERLKKVTEKQPNNLEAIAFLADAYAAKGENAKAIECYQLSKRLANDSHYSKEVDQRIQMLQKK